MNQERKLISFLGHTKGTCEVLAEGQQWISWDMPCPPPELFAPSPPQGSQHRPWESALFPSVTFPPSVPKTNIPS